MTRTCTRYEMRDKRKRNEVKVGNKHVLMIKPSSASKLPPNQD